MAAAASEPSKCHDGRCSCRRTQQTLDAEKEKRVAECETQHGEPEASAYSDVYRKHPKWMVFYDEVLRWCCADCDHKIGEHPPGDGAAPHV